MAVIIDSPLDRDILLFERTHINAIPRDWSIRGTLH